VNAAGVIGSGGLLDIDAAEWDRVMDSNLRSLFLMTQAAARALIERKGSWSISRRSRGHVLRQPARLLREQGGVISSPAASPRSRAPRRAVNAVNPGWW